jgi:predicted nuclease with TOPRIM domain
MRAVSERLERLRTEFERGMKQLEILDGRRSELRDTLIRIGGAIKVLEELVAEQEPELETIDAAAGA